MILWEALRRGETQYRPLENAGLTSKALHESVLPGHEHYRQCTF